jgi:pimeloyl-ACP methyl ester carboxylesterase
MASVNRRWLPPTFIAIAGMASVAVYGRVPAMVTPRLEGMLPFSTTDVSTPAPRWLTLSLMPVLALFVWAAFRLAATTVGQRLGRRMFRHAPEEVTSPAQFERFGNTYDTIVFGVVMLVLGLHAAVLAAVLQAPAIAARIVPAVFGACFLLMGNVMPRLRPNWVAGLRTKRLLEDPQLWRGAHRVFGRAFAAAGVVTILAAVVAPEFGLLVAVASVAVACVIGGVASTRRSGTARTAALVGVGLVCIDTRGIVAQVQPGAAPPVELSAPAAVAESSFMFTRDGLTLHGTLAFPHSARGRIPVVLIVAGSGPTDRNANGPLMNTNAYAMLAWGLAQHGIASARYDKRGIGESAGVGGDPTTLTTDTYVADVAAAAASLASDSRFSEVFLLGHSEGAGHVLQAANRGAPAAGVIMVAGQGRTLSEVLHEQFVRASDSATVTKIDSALARFLRGDEPGEVPPIAQSVIIPAYRNFFRSWAAYDPPAEARRFARPLLILQGTTDVQVTMRDAELLSAAQPRATFLRLDGVNHVLKSIQTTSLSAQMKTYHDPSMPLAVSVVPAIARWIGDSAR